MRNCAVIAGFLVLIVSLISACAPRTEVIKIYEDKEHVGKPYRRLLVVDVSSDPNRQESFENQIVAELRNLQVDGVASHMKLGLANDIAKDDIVALGDEIRADGVLVTHFVSVDSDFEVEEGRARVVSTCRRGDPLDYFLYDHEILKEPNSVKLAHTVIVVGNLYDSESRKLVWSIQSTCFDRSSMSEVLMDEASAIVNQLRIDSLI